MSHRDLPGRFFMLKSRITTAIFIISISVIACVEDQSSDEESVNGDEESYAQQPAAPAAGAGSISSDQSTTSYNPYKGDYEAPINAAPDNSMAAAGAGGSGMMATGGTTATSTPVLNGGMAPSQGEAVGVWPPPDSNEGDKYEGVGTNPFVITQYDPFSTFAADVDTASYDLLRRDVNNGFLPQPASVRLEEYVNYFTYDYPAPAENAEHPFSISLAAAPSIFSEQTQLLRVGIQAVNPPPFEKRPANIVFLIDVSGSMSSSDKLPLVQYLLTHTLDVLDPDDTVSIVTYASNTGVRLEPTPVSEKTEIAAVINALTAGGSTAGASGIELAYQQAEAGFIEGGINHVILCTDGDFNVGISSDQELVDLIVEKRESGITLTTVGFGTGNLNDSMMEKVSNAGNGIYSVVSSQQQAERYAEERMLNTLFLIAKDMKIQVEFNPDAVYAYRLLGYENRAIADEDFRDDTVDAGEIGAGHRVTALYELVMVGDEIPAIEGAPEPEDGDPVEGEREISAEDMVLVKVRYKDVDATEEDEAYEVSSTLQPGAVEDEISKADLDLQWAVAIASFAEILKQSPYADPKRLDAIESIIANQKLRDVDRQEFVQLFAKARSMIEAQTNTATD
jgi:Ca-activated chloride channel family protein